MPAIALRGEDREVGQRVLVRRVHVVLFLVVIGIVFFVTVDRWGLVNLGSWFVIVFRDGEVLSHEKQLHFK